MKRMKKTLIFCMSILTITFLFIAAFESYANDKKLCEEWCSQHKELCQKCSDKAGCGIGYQAIVTFKSDKDPWHACKGDETNKEACAKWCNANKPKCVRCADHIGCDIGYERLISFRGPGGKDWHACGKTEYKKGSEAAKAECNNWCNSNKPRCAKCDTHVGCGLGYKPIKSFGFGDRGDNWFACEKR
jgi:hypothetical protein